MHDNPHYHSKFTTIRSNHKPFCAFATFQVRSAILPPLFLLSPFPICQMRKEKCVGGSFSPDVSEQEGKLREWPF